MPTPPTARFCPRCGTRLDDPTSTCPACGRAGTLDYRGPVAAPATTDDAVVTAAQPAAVVPASEEPPKPGVRFGWAVFIVAVAAAMCLDLRGRLVLLVLLAAAPGLFAYLLAIALVGRAAGLRPMEFALGYGWPVVVVRWRSCLLRVNALPLGGYVKWPGDDDLPGHKDGDWPNVLTVAPDGGLRYNQVHPLKRCLMCLAGPATSFLIAVAILGPEGLASFVRGFEQYLGLPFRSREANAAILRPFLRVVEQGDLVTAAGKFAAKNAALNLLPFPISVGGMALIALYEWLRGRRVGTRWSVGLQYVSLVAVLAMFGFGVSACWHVFRHWPQ